MKKVLFFLLCIMTSMAMQAALVKNYEYQGMKYSYDTGTHKATLTDGKTIHSPEVTIPSAIEVENESYIVITIGNSAFYGNEDIKKVVISENVTTIEENAFKNCSQIRLLELPSTITSIHTSAFNMCSRIAHVCCKSADQNFINPTNIIPGNPLMTLYVPTGSKYDYMANEYWIDKFGDRIYEGDMEIKTYDGMKYVCATTEQIATLYEGKDEKNVTIPATFGTEPYVVRSIGRSAFYGYTNIENVKIEGSELKIICNTAFQNCSNLQLLELPSSLTTLGTSVFEGCGNLMHVWCKVSNPFTLNATSFPSNPMMTLYVPHAENYAGAWNTLFKGRIYEGEMKEWTDTSNGWVYVYATESKIATLYKGANTTEGITVPSTVFISDAYYSVTGIDKVAFKGCNSITGLTVLSGISAIGTYAFQGCSALKTVVLPASLSTLNDYAFTECSNLMRVTLINSTPVSINTTVFSSKRSLYVPSGSRGDYQSAIGWKDFFHIMEGVPTEVIDNGNTYICASVSNEAILTEGNKTAMEMTIPAAIQDGTYFVIAVEKNAFNGSTALRTLTFENSFSDMYIYEAAFNYCSNLRTVTLPLQLAKIDNNAFANCNNLVHVISKCTSPKAISGNVFTTTTKTTGTLYVPLECINIYRNLEGWNFVKIVDCDDMTEFAYQGMTYVGLKKGELYQATLTNGMVPENGEVQIPLSVTPDDITSYSVIAIGEASFKNKTALKKLTFQNSVVETIEANAFDGCANLKYVKLPQTLTAIGDYAFNGCINLTDIESLVQNPFPISNNVFSITDATVYVPNGRANAYKATAGWSLFARIYNGQRTEVTKGDYTYVYATGENFATIISNTMTDPDIVIPTKIPDIDNYVTAIDKSAFANNSKIKNLTIPEGVKSIGKYAFQNCSNLAKVILPASLTEIGDYAFDLCKNITNITSGITAGNLFPISDNVFYETIYNTAEVRIPINSVTAYKAKNGWKNFENYLEGDKEQTVIGKLKYEYLTGAKTATVIGTTISDTETELTIPGTIKINEVDYKVIAINKDVFKGKNIATLRIEKNVETIGATAFQDCKNLQRVWLPSTLTAIGEKAFNECRNITHLCSEVEEPFAIMENVFSAYTNATLFVPVGTATSYKEKDFWGKFQTITEGKLIAVTTQGVMTYDCLKKGDANIATLTKSTFAESDLVIPEHITYGDQSYDVTALAASVFKDKTTLKKVTLPETLTAIGENAFNGCTNLVNIISKIKVPFVIADNVFSNKDADLYVPVGKKSSYINTLGWNSMTNIHAGERVEVLIDGMTYVYATGEENATLTKGETTTRDVTIPPFVPGTDKKVTTIEKSAFANNSTLVNLTISGNVKTIGMYAFQKCTNLETIVLPASLTSIGDYAFDQCTKIATITSNIATPFKISETVFSETTYSTAAVYIPYVDPYGTMTAQYKAKDGWKQFINYIEGKKLKIFVGNLEYEYLTGAKTATVISANLSDADTELLIPGTFKIKEGEEDVEYKVLAINKDVFKNKTGIVNLKIDKNIETIGANAFQGCTNLQKIWLPKSMTTIGQYAFDGCKNITHVCTEKKDDIFTFNENVFSSYAATLYVPEGTSADYKSKDSWYRFSEVVEAYLVDVVTRDDMTFEILRTGEGESVTTTATLTKCSSSQDKISIPNSVPGNENIEVTIIGKSAFANKTTLVTLTISEGIKTIGANAFQKCTNLQTITLPASLESIGDNAFDQCTKITTIKSGLAGDENLLEFNENVFPDNVYSTATVSIPFVEPHGTATAAYKAKDGWKKFEHYIEGDKLETTINRITYEYLTGAKTATVISANLSDADTEVTIHDKIQIGKEEQQVDYDVIAIDNSAFANNTTLQNLTISEGIKTIGANAFQKCTNLETITLPASLTSIGDYTFDQCTKITTINSNLIGDDNLITFSDNVFPTAVYSTATVFVPTGVDKYKEKAGWKKFANIIEGKKLKTIVENIEYEYLTGDKTATVIGTTIPDTEINITVDATVNIDDVPYTVTAISNGAFKNKTNIENLIIDEGIESIGTYAFQGCTSLKKIWLPASLTSIGQYAFDGCKNITHICSEIGSPFTFNENVFSSYAATLYVPVNTTTSYKDKSYWNKFQKMVEGYLVNVTTQDGLTYDIVKKGETTTATLTKCETTESAITIPEAINTYKVTVIDKSAFANNTTLVNLIVSENVKTIGMYAFQKCTNLQTVVLPASLESMGDYAFDQCTKIATITSNITAEKLFEISDNVFPSAILTTAELYIPIGANAAYSTKNGWKNFVKRIEGRKMSVTVGNFTYECLTGDKTATIIAANIPDSETALTIPGTFKNPEDENKDYTVTAINKDVFKNKTAIMTLKIDGNIETIGANAFEGCTSLQKIWLPATLKAIDQNAFKSCTNITHISNKAATPTSIYANTFASSIFTTATLFVPEGAMDAYTNDPTWSLFTKRTEGVFVEVKNDESGMTYDCIDKGLSHIATLTKGAAPADGNLVIPEFVTLNGEKYYVNTISASTFKNMTSIKIVTLPAWLNTIGSLAFNGCTGITDVVCLGDVPPTMTTDVFSNATYSTATLYRPNTGEAMNDYAIATGWKEFKNVHGGERKETTIDGLTYVCATGETYATLLRGEASITEAVIPEEVDIEGIYLVEKIAENAFKSCTNLQTVTLAATLKSIGDNAFAQCSKITTINSKIPGDDDLLEFNENVFPSAVYSTATIFIPFEEPFGKATSYYKAKNGWKKFENYIEGEKKEGKDDAEDSKMVYEYLTGAKTATLVRTTLSAADTEVFIHGQVTIGGDNYKVIAIAKDVFKNKTSLVSLKIDENIETIGANAFEGCTNLQKIWLPSTLKSIDQNAFKSCTNITHIGSKITTPFTINANVFANYTKPKLFVPDNTTTEYQETEAWSNFVKVREAEFVDVMTSENITYDLLKEGSNIAVLTTATNPENGKVTIPPSIKYKNVAYTVTEIAESAFNGCTSLQTLVLPSTLKTIGDNAFSQCTKLTTINSNIAAEDLFPINENVFPAAVYSTATVYVPSDEYYGKTMAKYQNTAGWKKFVNYIEGEKLQETVGNMTYEYLTGLNTATIIATSITDADTELTIPGTVTIKGEPYTVTAINKDVFKDKTALVTLKIDEGIESIGAYAFQGCTNLQKIWLPSTLKSIGEMAFNNCKSITHICSEVVSPFTFNENVFSSYAATLYVPEGTTTSYRNKSYWSNFSKMAEGVLMGSKTASGMTYDCLLRGESKIAILTKGAATEDGKVIIPTFVNFEDTDYNVTEIAESAFKNLTTVKKIELPETLTAIGENAFNGCTNLTEIDSKIKEPFAIADNVFSTAVYTTATVYVPIGEEYGKTLAKYQDTDGWNNFINIIEGKKLQKTIDNITYEYLTGAKTATIIAANVADSETEYTIKGSVIIDGTEYKVTTINKDVFKNKTAIVNLKIGENIETIGAYAFQGCTSLKKIWLPSTLKVLGEKVFDGCRNITHICSEIVNPFTFNENVFSIYTVSLYIPEGRTDSYNETDNWNRFSKILEGYLIDVATRGGVSYDCLRKGGKTSATLTKCSSVPDNGSVSIPEQVTVKNVNYPVTAIAEYAFKGLTALTKVVLPATLTSIGDYAFDQCTKLADIYSGITGDKLFAISDNVFPSTLSPTIFIPIGSLYAYQNTNGWKRFWNNYIEGDRFQGPDDNNSAMIYEYLTGAKTATLIKVTTTGTAKEVTLPGKVTINGAEYVVTAIGESAFKENTNKSKVETLIISENIRTIGAYAFQECSYLTRVELPASLTEIGEKAFDKCSRLKLVVCAGKVPAYIYDNSFPSTSIAVVVPQGAAAAYKADNNWGRFNILEGEIIVKVTSCSRQYGDANPVFEYTVENGPVDGTPEIICEATETSPVGTYSIIIKAGSITNYNVKYVSGTLTIEKAPLDISAGEYTKNQGDPNPEFTLVFTGFKNNETRRKLSKQPTIRCEATIDSPAGEYPITISGAEAENYDITYTDGLLTIIDPTAISTVTTAQQMKIYDMNGNLIRTDAKSLEGLAKGNYIILMPNGIRRKVVVR